MIIDVMFYRVVRVVSHCNEMGQLHFNKNVQVVVQYYSLLFAYLMFSINISEMGHDLL